MSHQYEIAKEDSVIRVRTTGSFDFVGIFEMWEQIVAACNAHGCFRIIGLSNLDGPPASIDSYEYLGMLQAVGLTPKHRVAWVAQNPVLFDQMLLAETTIRNRSELVVRIFEDEISAEAWINSLD